MFFDDTLDFHFNTEQLMYDAVEEILRHEDHRLFFKWIQLNISNYFDKHFSADSMPEYALTSLAIMLGYGIWNAAPLPGNNFRPKPIPLPKRNDRCPCGSGRKYKQCCLNAVGVPDLEIEFFWAILIAKLPDKTLAKAIKNNRIPLGALEMLARDYLDDGKPKKTLALLEPFFAGDITKTGYDADMALNTLLDAYDDLNYSNKKEELIRRVTEITKKSPLRGGAWQRLATIKMDSGDPDGAWEAFRHAQRNGPNDPSMGALEVELLLVDNKIEQAKDRAVFWQKKVLKMGIPEDDPIHLFFLSAQEDPIGLNVDMELEMADGAAGIGLKAWLAEVAGRPAPVYEITCFAPETDSKSSSRKHQNSEWTQQMTLPFTEPADAVEPFIEKDTDVIEDWILSSPEDIARIQDKWHRVFPLPKPFSINFAPYTDEDPWDVFTELDWSEFLDNHPEAFDSIDILDDLAASLEMNNYFHSSWAYTALIEPILQRSRDIIEQTITAQNTPVRLSWLISENRPALRNLARLIFLYDDKGMKEDAFQLASWLLELNPSDNHGFRSQAVNFMIKQGKNQEALNLANRYPDDILPEIVLGRILALYRLKQISAAALALHRAMKRHSITIKYLWRTRVKKPHFHEHGVSIGGEDQAWLYRDSMRDVWVDEPGVLDWLKKESRKLTQ